MVYTIGATLLGNLLIEKNMKGRELDAKCGFSSGMTSRIMNGRAQNFTVDTAFKIARVFNVSIEDLLVQVPYKADLRGQNKTRIRKKGGSNE